MPRKRNMWNLRASLLFTLGILTAICRIAAGENSHRYQSSPKRLETYSSRYENPTNDPHISANTPFAFGYRFTDDSGTLQTREEKTDPNGSKVGSYSFVDAAGTYRRVDYIADRHGFRATVRTNEPGIQSADPAHVAVRQDHDKNLLPPAQQNFRTAPQLEYSNHVFSRFNFSSNFVNGNHDQGDSFQNSGITRPQAMIDSNRDFGNDYRIPSNQLDFDRSVNIFKGNPYPTRQPVNPIVLNEYNSRNPSEDYADDGMHVPDKFFNNENLNQAFALGDKLADSGFNNNPTFTLINPIAQPHPPPRFPRRLPDSQPFPIRKRPQYQIHTPRGFEHYQNLPLYRDK